MWVRRATSVGWCTSSVSFFLGPRWGKRSCLFCCVGVFLVFSAPSHCPSFPGKSCQATETDTVQALCQGNEILSQDPRHPTTPSYYLFILTLVHGQRRPREETRNGYKYARWEINMEKEWSNFKKNKKTPHGTLFCSSQSGDPGLPLLTNTLTWTAVSRVGSMRESPLITLSSQSSELKSHKHVWNVWHCINI